MRTSFLLPVFLIFFSLKLPVTGGHVRGNLKEIKITGAAQGTTYAVTYVSIDTHVSARQIDSIFQKMDSSLSRYKTYSLVSQFNNGKGPVFMDEHLKKVVLAANEINRKTKGVSDITVYPLVAAWDKATKNASLLTQQEVKKILPCIGAANLSVRGNRLFKSRPCIKIDLDGIAQGYSVDVIAGFLEQKGLKNYLVEIGGEIRARGVKANKAPFQIGIESPAAETTAEPIIKRTLSFTNGAITTSGNYRKFYGNGKKKLSHIIDPGTGFPVANELISVTVYAPNAMLADGYDNALLAMGLRSAFAFLGQQKKLEAYFIYQNADGTIRDTATKGFEKLFTELNNQIAE